MSKIPDTVRATIAEFLDKSGEAEDMQHVRALSRVLLRLCDDIDRLVLLVQAAHLEGWLDHADAQTEDGPWREQDEAWRDSKAKAALEQA